MTNFKSNYRNRKAAGPAKTITMQLREPFAGQSTRFAAQESEREGMKVSHGAIYETLLTKNKSFRQMVKAEQEAYARSEENQTSSRTTKEDPGIAS